jgi:hypothetical protein
MVNLDTTFCGTSTAFVFHENRSSLLGCLTHNEEGLLRVNVELQ